MPHRQSEHGPFVLKVDINSDDLMDLVIGGARNQATQLFLQEKDGSFLKKSQKVFSEDSGFEDIDAEFFDFENDGDLDIYIVSGSGEFDAESSDFLKDRLYLNDGNGNFEKASDGILPNHSVAGSRVLANDLDKDGDSDLIILNRNVPGNYPKAPKSYIYINQGNRFDDLTESFSKDFYSTEEMLVDGVLVDLDNNGFDDLITLGEWTEPKIFLNDGNNLVLTDDDFSSLKGWWRSIQASDLDNDGDLDLVLGNIGLNNKYKPKKSSPLFLFYNDFDNNGTGDIILSKSNGEELLPVRGRECSSQQLPFILDKFDSYEKFANADLAAIYSQEGLDASLKLEVNNFSSGILWNEEDGFKFKELPIKAQFGATNDIIVNDFNNDGLQDLLIAGNFYGSEVETVRYDSHFGTVLINTGNHSFSVMPYEQSGLKLDSDVRDIELLKTQKDEFLVVVSNDEPLRSFKLKN